MNSVEQAGKMYGSAGAPLQGSKHFPKEEWPKPNLKWCSYVSINKVFKLLMSLKPINEPVLLCVSAFITGWPLEQFTEPCSYMHAYKLLFFPLETALLQKEISRNWESDLPSMRGQLQADIK